MDLDKKWFEDTRFLFLWYETFEYIQNQIEQGYYIDDSKVGLLTPDSNTRIYKREVTIDGKTYKDADQAFTLLKSNDQYTIREVMFGNIMEYEIRRNIRLFDVSCIDDILDHIAQLKVIHNQEITTCVKKDLEFIRLHEKKKRKNYGWYIHSFVEKCEQESQDGKNAKEKNKELRKQNAELRQEINNLSKKLKTLEAQGDAQKMKKCAKKAVDSLLEAASLIKETYLKDE